MTREPREDRGTVHIHTRFLSKSWQVGWVGRGTFTPRALARGVVGARRMAEPRGSILYKFKSSTAEHSVQFDGPHIPLAELRAKIVADNNIVKGKDIFILQLSNAQVRPACSGSHRGHLVLIRLDGVACASRRVISTRRTASCRETRPSSSSASRSRNAHPSRCAPSAAVLYVASCDDEESPNRMPAVRA